MRDGKLSGSYSTFHVYEDAMLPYESLSSMSVKSQITKEWRLNILETYTLVFAASFHIVY